MRANGWILSGAVACAAAALVVPANTSATPVTDQASAPVETVDATVVPAETPVEAAATPPADPDPIAPPPPPARAGGDAAARGSVVQVTPTLPPPPPTTVPPVTTPPDSTVLPWNSGTGRRVVYSLSAMRVWAVEADGTVVKTHRVSGKRGVPNPGTYSVWGRSLHTVNIDNPNVKWMYMIRFAKGPEGGNIGFHEIPTECNRNGCWKLQTEAQLGRALSGGCVRQATPDAQWMWNWAGIGTKVVVLP